MKIKKIAGAAFGLVILIAALYGSFYAGLERGKRTPYKVEVEGVSNLNPPPRVTADMGVFWQVWQLINDRHLNGNKVDSRDKVYGAVRGLVGALGDPYTEFFTPPEGKSFEQEIQGNFGGIGVEIGIRKNQLVVISPLKGTPADKAGLKAGDQILKINASSTENTSVDEAVRIIRGPQGSKVTLTIFRPDWEKPRDVVLTRANIEVPTLDYKELDGKIAHIQLYSFNANADRLFHQAASRALKNGDRGVILDLRNNPGGFLEVAVDLAGWFLPKGDLVVSEESRTGTTERFTADGNEALKNIPVVIIINKGSASAAEILAGALHDQRRITLVGEQSFGKGTVQQLEDLKDGSSIKITIAHWVLPSGQILENGGIKPDVEVALSDEDTAASRDPQLNKATEILKSQLK